MGMGMYFCCSPKEQQLDNLDTLLDTGEYEEIGYLGKPAAVFWWLRDNVGYIADSTILKITEEQIQRLLRDCSFVLEEHSKACKLLPLPDEDNYDNSYFFKVREARNVCEDILKWVNFDNAAVWVWVSC